MLGYIEDPLKCLLVYILYTYYCTVYILSIYMNLLLTHTV